MYLLAVSARLPVPLARVRVLFMAAAGTAP